MLKVNINVRRTSSLAVSSWPPEAVSQSGATSTICATTWTTPSPARRPSFRTPAALTKNAEEDEHLRKKYERELIQKYKISESELKAIKMEGLAQQWPLPPPH